MSRQSLVLSRVFSGAVLAAGALSLTALALGALSPATVQEGFTYVDNAYLGGGAIVGASLKDSAGSGTEKDLAIQVKLPAGAGSLTEDTFFVGTIAQDSSLPASVALRPANSRYEPVSSRPEGALDIDQFDRTALKGELFGYDLEALPRQGR